MTPQWRKAELYDPSFSCSGSTTLVVYHTEGTDWEGETTVAAFNTAVAGLGRFVRSCGWGKRCTMQKQ